VTRTHLFALLASLAACVGSPPPPATIENTTFAPSLDVQLKNSTQTPSGVYYRDLVAGTGAAISIGQITAVHYTGWLANGTKFDSNVGGAAFSFVFGAGQVIPGLDDGLLGAHVGASRQLIIPANMAFGPQGRAAIPPNGIAIPPNAILVFTVQIDSALTPTVENTTFAPALDVQLPNSTKLPNGVYYRDLVVGTGAVLAAAQRVSTHYTGWLANGIQFDSNVGGAVFSFILGAGQVIGGWDTGLVGAHVGGKRQLIIPPQQAYGLYGQGPIPPMAILVFTVQIDAAL
jgi:peptidylprolyl isomerase